MKDKLGLKDSLNEKQFEAVMHGNGPCLLIAGAGSGKTTVVVNRVVNLISNGINPSNICLQTFTNKAAGEMRNRVGAMLEKYKIESVNKIFAGNFHSLAFSYIRANKDVFSISKHKLDTTDDLFRNSIKIIKKKLKTKGLPQSSEIISIYNKSINMMISIERVIMIKHKELNGYEEFVVECCEQYEEDKLELEYIDFNDMLVYFLKALKNNKSFKKMINTVYKYILIDEYQDTNPIQDEIVFNMLDKKLNNIMVIGDDAQCWDIESKVLTSEGKTYPVKYLGKRQHVECLVKGKINFKPITKISEQKMLKRIEIKTESGKVSKTSVKHKFFTTEPDFDGKSWYVYLMYRRDLGFRIGILSGGSSANINTRTMTESAEKLWIITRCEDEASASYKESFFSLQYKIPKTPYLTTGRSLRINEMYIKKLFLQFGQNGLKLMKDYNLSFDFPNFISQGTERHSKRKVNINLTFNQNDVKENRYHISVIAENKGKRVRKYFNDYVEARAFAFSLKNKLGDDSVIVEKFRLGRKRLNIVPATQLTVGMSIPIKDNDGNIVLEKIDYIHFMEPGKVRDIEVAGAGNLIADNVVSHNSVFGFNGADYKNILNFPNKFDNCKIIKLEQNYRSTQQILNIPNAIMTSPDYTGFNKTLFSDKSGPLPDVTVLFSREEEAEYVANKIQKLIEQKGELYMNNIAVLFRSAFASSELEIKLNIKNIKYKKFGGLGYFEKAHIKDFLSFLSAAYRSKDYISWLRILGLVSGIGEVKSSKMVKKIKVTKNTVIFEDKYKDESCWLELKRVGEMISLLKKNPSINSFDKVKEDYFVFMENQSEYKENTYRKRRMDFIALKNIAEKFPNLKSFSNTLNSTEKEKVDKRQGNFVTLSTIHSAKGLEWNHVFIIGTVDGIFPSKRSFSSQEDMNEERRLMYVALTRVKTFLEITFYSEMAHMESSLHQLNRFFSKDVDRSFYNFNYKKRDFEVIEKMRNFTNY